MYVITQLNGPGPGRFEPHQLPGSAIMFSGSRGLQDELEFYELLDMDVLGEQDTDVVVDGMSEAVPMSN
jgi:hypothetical protein